MDDILPLALYFLICIFLTILPLRKAKRTNRKRYSCRMVDGQAVDKKYF